MTPASQPDPRAYILLAALIRDQITSGEIEGAARLPPMGEMMRKHQHSRQTVGKAMRILEGDGLIYRVPGLGYFASVLDRARGRPG